MIKARVLIVDDDPLCRQLLQKVLERAGYFSTVASNAGSAIAEFSQKNYDIVMLDLEMPGMGGLELFYQLTKTGKKFKSIIITGHASLESAIQAIRYRVDDYLLKPIQPEKVIAALEKVLSSKDPENREPMNPASLDVPTRPTTVIKIGSRLTVDFNRRTITDGVKIVRMTSTEGRLFESMVDHLCEVISYSDLVEMAHGYRMSHDDSAIILRPIISRLRKKLQVIPGADNIIHSVRGAGYVLDPEFLS